MIFDIIYPVGWATWKGRGRLIDGNKDNWSQVGEEEEGEEVPAWRKSLADLFHWPHVW